MVQVYPVSFETSVAELQQKLFPPARLPAVQEAYSTPSWVSLCLLGVLERH